jgi:hypothetical protein
MGLECVSDATVNCCQGGKCLDSMCPASHHCCWQGSSNNNLSSPLGICVKRDESGGTENCDFKRGLPVESCKGDQSSKYAVAKDPESRTAKLKKVFSEEFMHEDMRARRRCQMSQRKRYRRRCFSFCFVILLLVFMLIVFQTMQN